MADCTCRYERPHWAFSPQWAGVLVWRDPICAVHYEPQRAYGPDGEPRPLTERFPANMRTG